MHYRELLSPVTDIAREACTHILGIYDSDFDVETKKDDSPLTQADLAAHRSIVAGLSALTPDIPILSEESADIPYAQRRQWTRYWLVDPLDGTKEFVKRNGEFTVNIALIDNGAPVLGVVWVPVTDRGYCGLVGEGAYVRCAGSPEQTAISVRNVPPTSVSVAGSRSHGNAQTEAFISKLDQRFDEVEIQAIGSSLKFCLVAEGKVDIYPRFGPTSEWDTGAAQAVVEAAGGRGVDTSMAPLRYNTKDSLLNPHFLVFGDNSADWEQYLTND